MKRRVRKYATIVGANGYCILCNSEAYVGMQKVDCSNEQCDYFPRTDELVKYVEEISFDDDTDRTFFSEDLLDFFGNTP